jgi:glycosyltransferase involved in cell wall biosynthesis
LHEEFSIPGEALILGVTGRLLPKKGYLSFFRAAKLAIDHCHNQDFRLAVIGGVFNKNQERYLKQLKDLARELNISDRVIFTGFKKDIKPYVSDLDILIVPSIWDEPFGRTALEGMALGIPVIASRVGGLPEVVEDGVCGFLYEKENHEALSDAIQKLIYDPELRQRMGRNGRRISEEKFDIRKRTQDIDKVLSQLLNNNQHV